MSAPVSQAPVGGTELLARTSRAGFERTLGLAVGSAFCFFVVAGLVHRTLGLGVRHWPWEVWSTLAWVPAVIAFAHFVSGRSAAGCRWCRIAALAQLVCLVGWLVGAHPGQPDQAAFWIGVFPGMAGIVAVIGFGAGAGWFCYVVACLLVEAMLWRLGAVGTVQVLVARVLFSLLYSGFFVGIATFVMRAVNAAVRQIETTIELRAEAAGRSAHEHERARLQRLTHDRVMSLLCAAASGEPSARLRSEASTVLNQLEQGFGHDRGTRPLAELIDQTVARARREGFRVITGPSSHGGELPAEIAAELEAAVQEALDNSLRHAGECDRVVRVESTDTTVRWRICDTGRGFRGGVEGRLGVAQSILGRVNSLPGGYAEVRSEPGAGTRVRVEWADA